MLNLFNVRSGQLVTTYKAHSWPIHSLAISAAPGAHFISSGVEKSIFLWDPTIEYPIRKLYGHQHRVNALQWAGPGDVVAVSASYDRTIRLWDVRVPSASRTPIQILEDARDSVEDVHVVGNAILAGGVDGMVRRYDIRLGRLIADEVQESIVAVAFTEDCQAYLATCLDSTLRLFDVGTGVLLNKYEGHTNTQFKVKSALGDNDSLVISGSETGELFFWDFLSATIRDRISLHQKPITAITAAPKKMKKLLVTSLDGTSSIIPY